MAKDIMIAEWFYSIQGEGPNAGRPSIFLRTSACNLTCKAWSGPQGCDTAEVWKKGTKYSIEQMLEYFDKQGWLGAFANGAMQTITGGEPMLWQEQLTEWMYLLKEGEPGRDPYTEIETNGTIEPKNEFMRWINHWNCSPKLASAGDPLEKRYKPDVLRWIAGQDSVMFKFVVNVCNKNTADQDLEEIEKIRSECNIETSKISLMAEGYTREQCLSNMIPVIELAKKTGYRFSPRLHVYAWDRVTGV